MNKIDYYKRSKSLLKLRRLATSTQKLYLASIYNFLKWCDCPQSRIGKNEFIQYISQCDFKSTSKQNQVISGLKFLYFRVMGKVDKFPEFKRPKKSKSLPKIVDKDVMLSRINSIKNLKHRAILSLAFSTGMRISEMSNLKIDCIDSSRMLILVENGKGKKDRYVKLTDNILELLRLYFKSYKPKTYLFNGDRKLKYSTSSLSKISHKYLKCNFHRIRHSAATAMMEAGTNMRILANQLGHSDTRTTEIYTHVSNDMIQLVKPPM